MSITISDDLVCTAEELHATSFGGPCGFLLTWLDMVEDNESKRPPLAFMRRNAMRGPF